MRLGDLDARIVGPVDGEGPVVVLLHGFGAPGDDLVPLARVLRAKAGTRFVFPVAPLDLGRAFAGGRAWWLIDLEARLRAGGRRDLREVPDGLAEARQLVDGLLDDVARTLAPKEGAPADGQLVLGGFSQGAMLALDVALRSDRALAGLVLMSGTHLAADEWAARLPARRGLPVFMSHGRDDELLPFATSEGLRDTLSAAGLPVTWVPFGGGHGIPERVLEGVSGFLEQTLRPGQ